MTIRRRPLTPREFARTVHFRRPVLGRERRSVSRAQTIGDLRALAARRAPRGPFDYTDGGAESEISLARAQQAFLDVEFHPQVLRDVTDVDTSVEVLGGPSALPFGIAPTGFTRLMHTQGEYAGAAAAGAAGIPFSLSTLGTASIEDVAAANPGGRNWFQLYMWRDHDRALALIDRAAAAGFDTLLVTVDVPVSGLRLRDVRNGLTIPPTLSPAVIADGIRHPRWTWDFLTTPPIEFAAMNEWNGTVAELLDTVFDAGVTYEELDLIRKQWPGKLVVKGVQTLDDAVRSRDHGADGVLLSNHGGRQLDRAPVPFHLLPRVARAIGGDVEVLLDTGIRSGADVVASLALGARFTLVGRAYLYGLMAGGRRGVDKAIAILHRDVRRTMRLLGAQSVADLNPDHVTQLARLAPRPLDD